MAETSAFGLQRLVDVAIIEFSADDDSIEDVILIAAAFATINRIADALGFALLTREQYDSGAKLMYKHGYDLI